MEAKSEGVSIYVSQSTSRLADVLVAMCIPYPDLSGTSLDAFLSETPGVHHDGMFAAALAAATMQYMKSENSIKNMVVSKVLGDVKCYGAGHHLVYSWHCQAGRSAVRKSCMTIAASIDPSKCYSKFKEKVRLALMRPEGSVEPKKSYPEQDLKDYFNYYAKKMDEGLRSMSICIVGKTASLLKPKKKKDGSMSSAEAELKLVSKAVKDSLKLQSGGPKGRAPGKSGEPFEYSVHKCSGFEAACCAGYIKSAAPHLAIYLSGSGITIRRSDWMAIHKKIKAAANIKRYVAAQSKLGNSFPVAHAYYLISHGFADCSAIKAVSKADLDKVEKAIKDGLH